MPTCRDWLLTALVYTGCVATAAATTDDMSVNDLQRAVLRADWAHPSTTPWEGCVRVSQGRITSVRVLDMGRGLVRQTQAEGDQTIRFRTDGAGSWSGIEFALEANPCARLEFSLDGHSAEARVDELMQGKVFRLDAPGDFRIRRDPADILKINLNRPHLIFSPGETADVDVDFRLQALEACTVRTQFQVAMRGARGGEWLFATQANLAVPVNAADPVRRSIKVRMPTVEGVYDLVLRAEPEGLQTIERELQFVVFNPEMMPNSPSAELDTRVIQELDPAKPNVAGPWYSTRRLRDRTSRLGRFLWTSVRHPFSPHDRAGEGPIASYSLSVENPGLPHLVSIEYEDPGNLLLVASVADHAGDGSWTQIPMASAVRTGEKSLSGMSIHQMVFWPRTRNPELCLSLENSVGLSAVKKIRVLELPHGLPPMDASAIDADRRYFGLCLDNPESWGGWGSSRLVYPSGLLVDDWRTFWDSARHLTEYARFAGYNCFRVNVQGGGGALYPTRKVSANYRLDTGALSDSSQDAMRKDVVELLLRFCQRQRLRFLAGVRMDGVIAELESALESSDPQKDGLLLVSREGRPWERSNGSGWLPERRYNPLNPEVQAAIVDVVRELVDRYAAEPAFEGLALDLAPASHLLLPGMDWGYDDATVAKFVSDTGMALPAIDQEDSARFAQRHRYLTTVLREPWSNWRCRQMSQLYEATLAQLQRLKPRASLFLEISAFTGPGSEDSREAMRSGRTIEEVLRSKGVDLRNWNVPRDVVVLRPFLASGTSPEGLQLNASRELEELLARLPNRGTLCIHQPEVPPPGAAREMAEKNCEATVEPVLVPVNQPGRANLRRYAQSLSGGDCSAIFDGGPAISLGHEPLQREFARVFRSLPPAQFGFIETLQPVVVRSAKDSRDALVYLVNDASYPVEVHLCFSGNSNSTLSNGSMGDQLSTHHTELGLGARLALDPFQVAFLRVSGPETTVVQCNVTVPQSAERGLKVRFDRLMQAMAVMRSDSSRTLEGLPPNGDFEEAIESDRPANWSTDGNPDGLRLDSEIFHGGQHALRVRGGAEISAMSEQFTPPEGRNFAMNVWLRANRPGQRIRWFLTAKQDQETVYQCYADVQLGVNWELKQFRARDLPEGQITGIQVRFQLLEEGTIWIDEARLCALPISQDEKLAISKSVSAIFKAWKERRLSDFERLSEGYWPIYLIETVEASKNE